MFKKGYKRTGKAVAVLHFFFGLILVAIFVMALYFFLESYDYSHRVSADVTMRPYVESTVSPEDPSLPSSMDMEPGAGNSFVDLTATATPTVEPIPEVTETPQPTDTPEPTLIPTATLEPTPTPEPTPEPTRIPGDQISTRKNPPARFELPEVSTDTVAELTNYYISVPNDSTVVAMNGYCYFDTEEYDCMGSNFVLVVTDGESDRHIYYPANRAPGTSGEDHADAMCKNASHADFNIAVNVSKYVDGDYKLGVLLCYDNNKKFAYHEFSQILSVKDGVAVPPAETFLNADEQTEDEGDVQEGDDVPDEGEASPEMQPDQGAEEDEGVIGSSVG